MKKSPKRNVPKRAAVRPAAKSVKNTIAAKAAASKKRAEQKAVDKKVAFEEAKKIRKEEVSVVLETLLQNSKAMEYIRQNVSRKAEEVLCLLVEPKTDEQISAQLDLKINTVRRILNILQGYGVTNYATSKDDKGWLSFFWSINTNKIGQFFDYIDTNGHGVSIVTDNCNDYFICKDCYKENSLIFNFDAACEANFRCTCNSKLDRIDRSGAEKLVAGEFEKTDATTQLQN